MDEEKELWCLVITRPQTRPYWMVDLGEDWENSSGGYRPKREDDQILEKAWIEHYDDLDHTKTGLMRDESEASGGWVDRDGKFYGCCYLEHDTLARLAIKKSVAELESQGWIRVWSMPDVILDDWDRHYTCRIRMTAAQRNTMSRIGFPLKDDD